MARANVVRVGFRSARLVSSRATLPRRHRMGFERIVAAQYSARLAGRCASCSLTHCALDTHVGNRIGAIGALPCTFGGSCRIHFDRGVSCGRSGTHERARRTRGCSAKSGSAAADIAVPSTEGGHRAGARWPSHRILLEAMQQNAGAPVMHHKLHISPRHGIARRTHHGQLDTHSWRSCPSRRTSTSRRLDAAILALLHPPRDGCSHVSGDFAGNGVDD